MRPLSFLYAMLALAMASPATAEIVVSHQFQVEPLQADILTLKQQTDRPQLQAEIQELSDYLKRFQDQQGPETFTTDQVQIIIEKLQAFGQGTNASTGAIPNLCVSPTPPDWCRLEKMLDPKSASLPNLCLQENPPSWCDLL